MLRRGFFRLLGAMGLLGLDGDVPLPWGEKGDAPTDRRPDPPPEPPRPLGETQVFHVTQGQSFVVRKGGHVEIYVLGGGTLQLPVDASVGSVTVLDGGNVGSTTDAQRSTNA